MSNKEINHSERKHSLLSASGASQWMNCTPSARRSEHLPDVESDYAKEGTLAHELSDIELKLYFGLITKEEYNQKKTEIENHELYTDDMPDNIEPYISYCIEQVNHHKSSNEWVEIFIEDKINLTEYIEDGFGSNDFVIITDNFIEVIDLKYGRGVAVSAIENEQLKLYALGTVHKHRLSYNMKDVKLTIVQPRKDNLSSYVLSVDDLEAWAINEVVPKAKIAFKGEGEFKVGSWCKFCKFKPKCKAAMEENLKVIKADFQDPHELSDEEFIEVYNKKEQVISWLNSVEAYMLNKLLNREDIEGFKLVKGRSTRKFSDANLVAERLISKSFKEDDIYKPKVLRGITAIEKLVGKKEIESVLGDLIVKTEPKPTIAPATDKRLDYFDSAQDDFKENL